MLWVMPSQGTEKGCSTVATMSFYLLLYSLISCKCPGEQTDHALCSMPTHLQRNVVPAKFTTDVQK